MNSHEAGMPTPLQVLSIASGITLLLVLGPGCGFGGGIERLPPPPAAPSSISIQLNPMHPFATFTSGWEMHALALAPAGGQLFMAAGPVYAMGRGRFARGTLLSMALSMKPDGKRLAIGYNDGSVVIVDPAGLKLIDTLADHGPLIRALAYSPDGGHLAVGTDSSVVLWEEKEGRKLYSNTLQTDRLMVLAYAPDGRHLAAGTREGNVIVWDSTSGEQTLRLHESGVIWGVAFDHDGKSFAISVDREVLIFDLNGRRLAELQDQGAGSILNLTYDKYRHTLYAATSKGVVLEYELTSPFAIRGFSAHKGEIESMTMSADGRTLATSGADGYVREWPID